MNDPDEIPDSRPHREKEYQDFHFHDDDDVVPADDVPRRSTARPAPRKPNRRPPPRRRYEDD
jgi:hypothetical protein